MKSKPWEAQIPQKPKFKDRKRLFLVVEPLRNDDGITGWYFKMHGEHWLTRDEEIWYALKGYELELLSSQSR